jgi:predicted MFS family arabinose efflux permease
MKKFVFRYFVGTFFFWFSQYVYIPILPAYLKELGCSLSMIGIVLGSYGISQFLLRIPLGFWADRKKVFKPFMLVGAACCGLSCLGFALFPSPWFYLGARTLSGVSASFWVIFTVFFASYFSEGESSKAMGRLVFCMSGALLVSTVLGGWAAEHYGYRAPFWIGGIGALISLVSLVRIEEKKVVGETSRMTLKKGLQIAASPGLIAISLAGAVLYFNTFATTYGFVPILAVNLGSNKTQLGVLLALNLASYSLSSLLVGTKLLNPFSERLVVVIAFQLIAITALALPFVSNLFLLYVNQIVHGIGRGFAYSILMGFVFRLVSSDERATAMGIFQSIYSFGIFTGPIVGGWVGSFWGINGIFVMSGVFTLTAIPLLWKMKISRRD